LRCRRRNARSARYSTARRRSFASRATIGQLAVQMNEVTAKAEALGKERDALKAKCSDACKGN